MTMERQEADDSAELKKAAWVKPQVTRLDVGEAEGADGIGSDAVGLVS